jgi:hypothetical protein
MALLKQWQNQSKNKVIYDEGRKKGGEEPGRE